VKAEITVILYKAQIKYLKSQGVWPVQFDEQPTALTENTKTPIVEEQGEDGPTLRLARLRMANSEEQEEDADDEEDTEEDEAEEKDTSEIFKNTNRFD